MIKKERLEELIEQGATIWLINFENKVVDIDLFNKFNHFIKDKENLKDYFENKEEAEHYAKYVNQKKQLNFQLRRLMKKFLKEEYFSIQWFGSIVLDEDDKKTIYFNSKSYKFDLPNTEENYYKCLRIKC